GSGRNPPRAPQLPGARCQIAPPRSTQPAFQRRDTLRSLLLPERAERHTAIDAAAFPRPGLVLLSGSQPLPLNRTIGPRFLAHGTSGAGIEHIPQIQGAGVLGDAFEATCNLELAEARLLAQPVFDGGSDLSPGPCEITGGRGFVLTKHPAGF